MRVIQREIFPFPPPATPVDALLQDPERGVHGVIHHASKLGHQDVLDAAVRGARAYLEENPGALASAEALHALVDRMARAVRQTGELLARSPADLTAARAATGGGFVPDPGGTASGFLLSAAMAWANQGDVFLATIGSCAAVLVSGGAIRPIHALDTLARFNPASGMGEPAHWMVLSALAADPANLTAGLVEQRVSLRSGEHLALLSPSMAVPVLELGARPTHPLGGAGELADWLVTLPEHHRSRPLGAVGAALVLSPEERSRSPGSEADLEPGDLRVGEGSGRAGRVAAG